MRALSWAALSTVADVVVFGTVVVGAVEGLRWLNRPWWTGFNFVPNVVGESTDSGDVVVAAASAATVIGAVVGVVVDDGRMRWMVT